MNKNTRWYMTMLEIHGSDEAIKEEMLRRRRLSREHPNNAKGTAITGFKSKKQNWVEIHKMGGKASKRTK